MSRIFLKKAGELEALSPWQKTKNPFESSLCINYNIYDRVDQ
jgi:hypothetical protein